MNPKAQLRLQKIAIVLNIITFLMVGYTFYLNYQNRQKMKVIRETFNRIEGQLKHVKK
jgi:hypothetical protein